ncbi:MAG: winged helix-turn-helix transcriptional regulator [Candidatus Thorarchaeota archaeon]|nr:winged helix-turn-helix transcriptional regulator [Candidatus Thorarchaeota archaeon]
MPQLDQIDKQILNILVVDCRTPYREIAKTLGMSATAIKSRVDDMIAGGVITDFMVEFTHAMIGAEAMMVWIKTDGTEDREQFISEIAANRGVMQICPLYGGDYLVGAEYTSSLQLATLTEAFKSNPHVSSTEMHTFLFPRGKTTNLTKLQLRVLKPLLKDARMLITDIAKETGLTVRLVRRTLRELKESEAIEFSLRWRLNVGDRVTFLLKLKWDPKQASRDKIIDMLQKKYQDEFWEILPSANDPVLFAAATVDNLNHIDIITTEIRSLPAITYSEAIIYRPPHNFKGLRRLHLEEAIQAAGV